MLRENLAASSLLQNISPSKITASAAHVPSTILHLPKSHLSSHPHHDVRGNDSCTSAISSNQ